MAAMATLARAPRDAITPEAFRVADHLIGIPLARPSRRLGAILIDLLLVAILVALLDALAFVVGLVGAVFVFRLSRAKEGRWYKRFYRRGLGCFGALLTFVVALVAIDAIGDLIGTDDPDPDASVTADSSGLQVENLGMVASGLLLRDGFALRDATRPGERDTLADAIVGRLIEHGLSLAEVQSAVDDVDDEAVLPPAARQALAAAVETTSARLEKRAPRSPEQMRAADSAATAEAVAAAAASTTANSAAADTLSPLEAALAASRDSLQGMRDLLAQRGAELEQERAEHAAAVERRDQGAFRWVLASVSDELGLGLGWLGLYFTAFTVLGGGQTPGKRVFRLRVIRLDGRPIGWWQSLQRFGGYSASVFTGMLGFAEMFWDDNRQALQDKLVHTVVIQEPKKPWSDLAAPGSASAGVLPYPTAPGEDTSDPSSHLGPPPPSVEPRPTAPAAELPDPAKPADEAPARPDDAARNG